jgi:hypothetical protein
VVKLSSLRGYAALHPIALTSADFGMLAVEVTTLMEENPL